MSAKSTIYSAAFLVVFICLAAVTHIQTLVFAGIASATLVIVEGLRSRRAAKARARKDAWPGFIEYLVSALESGTSMFEAMVEAPGYFDGQLGLMLTEVRSSLVSGDSPSQALKNRRDWLDFSPFVQLAFQLEGYELTGAPGMAEMLRSNAVQVRAEASLDAELRARTGWVLSTARLGVASPWLMVVLLSQRSEARLAYQGQVGVGLLTTGLAICILAYLLILARGNRPSSTEMFWVIP